jgi:pimeloyl-ACP methyl ester carboxylesterase
MTRDSATNLPNLASKVAASAWPLWALRIGWILGFPFLYAHAAYLTLVYGDLPPPYSPEIEWLGRLIDWSMYPILLLPGAPRSWAEFDQSSLVICGTLWAAVTLGVLEVALRCCAITLRGLGWVAPKQVVTTRPGGFPVEMKIRD